ncbi:MAG: WD40 repeat domain-containing protein [Heteroscytonema crispum UTEX LB 1556]
MNAIAFSPDGKKIATGSDDKTVKIWKLETGEEPATLKAHFGGVYAVAFNPDGKTLVSASADNSIKIWQIP